MGRQVGAAGGGGHLRRAPSVRPLSPQEEGRVVVVQMVVAGRAEMATPPPPPPPRPSRACQGGVRGERERGDAAWRVAC